MEISTLLISVAGAFSDGLVDLGIHLANESFWTRLLSWLSKTTVDISELGFSAGVSSLKVLLRTEDSFRQRLQEFFRGRLAELQGQVNQFVEDGLKEIEKKEGVGKRLVFLMDSLEKNRGTPSNEREVMANAELLFRNHFDMLQLPYVHCVYSVPAWLPYIITQRQVVLIPAIKFQEERGADLLRHVVLKRFGPESLRLIFGEPNCEGRHSRLDRIIDVSGGTLGDLLRILRVLLLRIDSLPASDATVEAAIEEVKNDFRTNVEDALWMSRISRDKNADLPNSNVNELNRLMRLLENHMVLYFRNATDWYDIHPLVRGHVERMVRDNPSPAPESLNLEERSQS